MKSILLHVGGDRFLETRLQGALDLARFAGSHLECLQTRRMPPFIGQDALGISGSAAMLVRLMEDEARQAEEERRSLEKRLGDQDVPFSFRKSVGEPGRALVSHSQLADVIVMTLPPEGETDLSRALAVAVTHADAPVLAIPHQLQRLDLGRPALVAWKETREAAHAVKRAVPLLRKCRRVDILAIDPAGSGDFPPTRVAAYLSRHGIKAELHQRTSGSSTTSDVLLGVARELDSGLIVMGGYGRSRAMEFLLGGVTRRLVAVSHLPLLMAH